MRLIYPFKNLLKTVVFTSICILIGLSLFLQSSNATVLVDLEWKVNVGDSKTYIISKLCEEADYDGNGDPTTILTLITDINKESVEILLMEGSTFTVEIISLNDSALIQITYNGNITTQPQLDKGRFIEKTTEEQGYWEQVAKDNPGCSTSGDLFTLEQTINDIDSVRKYNMTSGWLEYSHRSYDDAFEEFSGLDFKPISEHADFSFLFSFLGILVLGTLIRIKSFQHER
ncbi:MAG: hypothetical protein ACXABI_11875 [Candidatus Hodarchaeales archaeon]|jgi:hypothetical protein